MLLTAILGLIMLWRTTNQEYKETRLIMDTIVEIKATGYQAPQAVEAAFEVMEAKRKLFDVYDEKSELAALNRNPNNEPILVSPEFKKLLQASFYYYQKSGRCFDISILTLTELWQQAELAGQLPTQEQIAQALAFTGMDKLEFDEAQGTISVPKGMKLDLGGIAKGYIADCGIDAMKKYNLKKAIINAGGDIATLGAPPSGRWEILVDQADDRQEAMQVYLKANEAIATSGNNERFYEIEKQRYSHIIDPQTGYPLTGSKQASVIARSAMAADATATCLMVMDPADVSRTGFPGADTMVRSKENTLISDSFRNRIIGQEVPNAKKLSINVQGERVREQFLHDKETDKFAVEAKSGKVWVEIKDGKVRVTEAPCPDKICVQRGWISKKGQQIICVPNQLIISIE